MKTYDAVDLRKSLPHLAFEFYHFSAYRRFLNVVSRFGDCRGIVDQAVRYALLLHFRLLVDFFFWPPKDDDISVRHFSKLDDFKDKYRPAKLIEHDVKDLRGKLNKHLAHLTGARFIEGREPMNYYARNFDAIEACISAFVQALPPEFSNGLISAMQTFDRRDERCNEYLKQIRPS